jgi:thiosulfate dehydrogenase
MFRILLGIVIGIILVPVAVMGWFKYGHPPVAVADKPLPFERNIVAVPMHARIDSELVKTPPIQADEATFVAGAQIYRDDCSECHGFHGKTVAYAEHMYPRAPALWEKHRNNAVVGVSDEPPGETYWKVANGIRLSGMPSFNKVLSDTQMWQVSLLLANADKPLPPAALALLTPEPAAELEPAMPAKKK